MARLSFFTLPFGALAEMIDSAVVLGRTSLAKSIERVNERVNDYTRFHRGYYLQLF